MSDEQKAERVADDQYQIWKLRQTERAAQHRPCLFDCKSEGPPGPIWCTQCGHDPKCCNCDD
jgi:hypothetical protein